MTVPPRHPSSARASRASQPADWPRRPAHERFTVQTEDAALQEQADRNIAGSASTKTIASPPPIQKWPALGHPEARHNSTSVPGSAEARGRSAVVDFVVISLNHNASVTPHSGFVVCDSRDVIGNGCVGEERLAEDPASQPERHGNAARTRFEGCTRPANSRTTLNAVGRAASSNRRVHAPDRGCLTQANLTSHRAHLTDTVRASATHGQLHAC